MLTYPSYLVLKGIIHIMAYLPNSEPFWKIQCTKKFKLLLWEKNSEKNTFALHIHHKKNYIMIPDNLQQAIIWLAETWLKVVSYLSSADHFRWHPDLWLFLQDLVLLLHLLQMNTLPHQILKKLYIFSK